MTETPNDFSMAARLTGAVLIGFGVRFARSSAT